jgi:leader peptidase (prepilin peptidase)/N-methyltransferase
MFMIAIYLVTLILGLLFGSFFNVCIYRIPRNESIVFPGSHCPHCDRDIKPWDNIPVLSYLILRGKCRFCKAGISWRYPLVESLTAALFLYTVHRFSISWDTLVYSIFVSALIVISFIDIDYRIIPDVISLPGIILGFLAAVFLLPLQWHDSLLGILIGGGVILAVGYLGELVFKKEAMGGGDVKLLAMIGAFVGWKLALLTIFFGSLAGAVIGLVMKLFTGDEYIPFGPFLALGALAALCFGERFLHWYWLLLAPPQ